MPCRVTYSVEVLQKTKGRICKNSSLTSETVFFFSEQLSLLLLDNSSDIHSIAGNLGGITYIDWYTGCAIF